MAAPSKIGKGLMSQEPLQSAPRLLDVVELMSRRADIGLSAGALGTIVEELPGNACLVEFSDDNGETLSIETVTAAEIAVRR